MWVIFWVKHVTLDFPGSTWFGLRNRNWNSTWLCLRKLPDFHRVSYTLGDFYEVFWQSKVAREFHGPSYTISWGVAKTL